jgi:putative oxidoreductase
MYSVQKIEEWADKHHPKWLELIRIILGLIILTKGAAFIFNREEVIDMIQFSTSAFLSFIIAHYVITSFLVGGVAIIIGLYTRTACILQIPAVLGSIVLVEYHKNLFALNSLISYSVLVLFLLLFYTFYGSGVFSLDNYLKKNPDKQGSL